MSAGPWSADSPARGVGSAREEMSSSALLERRDELAAIERALDDGTTGAGALLIIEGEAGAGKTSLLDELDRLGREKGSVVLRARGGEYERDFTYGLVRQLFEPALADEGRREDLLTGTAAMASPIFGGDVGAPTGSEPLAMQH